MVEVERVSGMSMDIEGVNKEKLMALFPQCFNEGMLDIDKLLNLCGEYIDNDFEKYKFEWKGKSECYRIAGKRSTGTLRPCKEESVNFDTTKNMYIEGDNLEVLKLLQASYYRKVKMIYIDPPYNTGNDFVYEDDFADPMAKYKEVTGQTTKSNPETMGRYHTNWLNMMYPRLRLASNLLRDDGVIFISIDDHELHNLRKLCDEVFGEENFLTCISRATGTPTGGGFEAFVNELDYVVVYAKSYENLSIGGFDMSEEDAKIYNMEDCNGKYLIRPLRRTGGEDRREDRPSMYFPLIAPDGTEVYPIGPTGYDSRWICGKDKYKYLMDNNLIEWKKVNKNGIDTWQVYQKFYLENRKKQPGNLWVNVEGNKKATRDIRELFDTIKTFDFPKPIEVMSKLITISTNNNNDDIILDFFSGSATTAHAVMQLNAEDNGNRQYIMVQLPALCDEDTEAFKAGYSNICEIGKERIRRAGAKIAEQNENVDTGFKVFKLDTSNLVKWDSTPTQDTEELTNRMALLKDTIKPDRNDLDMVYETMLKLGIPLDYPVTEVSVNDKKAYSIGEECLVLICLDYGKEGITADDVKTMCEEYVPAKIVASEQAFKDDVALSNAHYILKDHNIEMKLL